MTDDEDGAGGSTSPGAASTDNSSPRHRARRRGDHRSVLGDTRPAITTARNAELPPDARRAQPAWAIFTCPFCGDSHLHRGRPGVRRAPCGSGRYYVGPWST